MNYFIVFWGYCFVLVNFKIFTSICARFQCMLCSKLGVVDFQNLVIRRGKLSWLSFVMRKGCYYKAVHGNIPYGILIKWLCLKSNSQKWDSHFWSRSWPWSRACQLISIHSRNVCKFFRPLVSGVFQNELRVPDLNVVCTKRCEEIQFECILDCGDDSACISQCVREISECLNGKSII